MDSRTQGYCPRPPCTTVSVTWHLLPHQTPNPCLSCAPVLSRTNASAVGGHTGAQGNLPFPSVAEASCKCLIDLKITMWRAEVSRGAWILFYFWL